jgi:hypothetical protein
LARGSTHQGLLLAIGAAALAGISAGLIFRWSAGLACGIAALGVQQTVRLVLGPNTVDPWTPLYAGGLLLAAELAWWSIEPRVPAWSEPGTAIRRFGTATAFCGLGSALSALVVLAAGAPLEGGVSLELVGVVAAAGALAVVAIVARGRVG